MPTFVTVYHFWREGKTGLSRDRIKQLCLNGVIPHILSSSGKPLIDTEEAVRALKAHAEEQAKRVMDRNGKPVKRKDRGNWEI